MPKILLVLGFVLLFALLQYQGQLKDFWSLIIDKAAITYDNFFKPTGEIPERKRPLSFLKRQVDLQMFIGEPFKSFSEEDWNEFWNIVYGGFAMDEAGAGLPRRMRQMSKEEIENALTERYPQPFAYFDERVWKQFFEILFSK